MSVNIGEANQGDAFYRYKMPKLQSRIQGRGNGIKTEVVNNVEIAKALERQPDYILKFYGCELGAQTNFDKKTGTSIVNGAHDTKRLIELLELFIKKYVQCYDCGNPETVVKIKRENIMLLCKACGFVSDVDMRHRLNTYILKNPPEEKLSKAEKKLRKEEKERLKEAAGENLDKEEKKKRKKEKESKKKKSKNESGGPNVDDEDVDDGDEDDDVQWLTDTSAAAAQKRAQEQLTSAMASMVTQGNIEAEKLAAEKREEKRRLEEIEKKNAEEAAKKAALESEQNKATKSLPKEESTAVLAAVDKDFVSAIRESLAENSPDSTAKYILNYDISGGLAERMTCLLQAMLEGLPDGRIDMTIKKHQAVLKSLAKAAAGQLALLLGYEHFIAVTCPSQINQVVHTLKSFYDYDVAEEEIILAWHKHSNAARSLNVSEANAAKVRKASIPFITWLQEDEDDSDSST